MPFPIRTLRSAAALLAGVACVFATSVGRADDTEIFFGANTGASGRPNILFVIDTSGSMASSVVTRPPYDAMTDYPGTCRDDRIYWTSGTAPISPPTCGTNNWVPITAFQCATANGALAAVGVSTQARVMQWRAPPNRWQTMLSGNRLSVECGADDAIPHGNGTLLYPTNTAGPYTNTLANRLALTGGAVTFYSGNYVNYIQSTPPTVRSRLRIVQDVLNETIDSLDQVNVGLMRFDAWGQGGMVMEPVAPIETNRTAIKTQVNAMVASGTTPLAETFYEAASYLRGDPVFFGNASRIHTGAVTPSVPGSRVPANPTRYQSYIQSNCQKSFIVYLTDGEPVADTAANSRIRTMPGFTAAVGPNCGASDAVDGACFDELAEYLFETDQSPTIDGVQNVTTYTIGFGPAVAGSTLLSSAAARGGGEAYDADDTATLTTVLQAIVRNILTQNTFFTSPTVSVNAFNRTRNLNDLYITMFRSTNSYRWPGNLKKYRVMADGMIVGADGLPAVDPSTGFFRSTAQSFWRDPGDPADGSDVTLGGAAHRLPDPGSRRLYSNLGAGADLTDSENRIEEGNGLITNTRLGLPVGADDDERDQLIEWLLGADVDDVDNDGNDDEQRHEMGDPLNAQPVSVIYGGTAASPDVDDAAVFFATNDGFLHAIDPASGKELWAFVPRELLPRSQELYANDTVTTRGYGLDGNLRVFRLDKDRNGVIEPADGDRVYLVFGMRRGGSSYFALDVTEKDSPRLLWRRGPAQLPGIGQSWSTPTITRVNVAGATQNAEKLVAIFGGGYDPTQDNVPYNTDDVGNRLFIVDLESGALLWRAGPASGAGYDPGANLQLARMNNSIPADVRVIDLANDGFADRMYASDTGGRIWRFDIYNGQPANSLVTGGVFASLGVADGTGSSPVDARRFFYAPDVSQGRVGSSTFFTLSTGSGMRGRPLNKEVQDRFYGIRDFQPYRMKTQAEYDAWVPITDTHPTLVDVTGEDTPVVPESSVGWKMSLQTSGSLTGEKALAEARTFAGQVFFTTYTPHPDTFVGCTVTQGANRLYIVDAKTGGKVPQRDAKHEDLQAGGIASTPAFMFLSNVDRDNPFSNAVCNGPNCDRGGTIGLVGVEDAGTLPETPPVRTYWQQRRVDQ